MGHCSENKLEACLGHITLLRDECLKCKEDEFNKYCPQYKPVQIYEVEDGTKNKS